MELFFERRSGGEDARMKRKKAERVTQCEGFATITSILRDDYAAVTILLMKLKATYRLSPTIIFSI